MRCTSPHDVISGYEKGDDTGDKFPNDMTDVEHLPCEYPRRYIAFLGPGWLFL